MVSESWFCSSPALCYLNAKRRVNVITNSIAANKKAVDGDDTLVTIVAG